MAQTWTNSLASDATFTPALPDTPPRPSDVICFEPCDNHTVFHDAPTTLEEAGDGVASLLRNASLAGHYHLPATRALWRVVPPVVAALGVVGNLLTVAVMTSRRARRLRRSGSGSLARPRLSLSDYFVALAVSDTLLLLSVICVEWSYHVFGPDLVLASEVVCELHVFIINVCSATSSWYLVGVTAQRTVAVLSPHRLAPRCTPPVRLLCLLLPTLGACLLHGHNLFAFRPGDDTQHVTVCDDAYRNNSSLDKNDSHPLADTILGIPIPFGLLILCNVLLVRKVYAAMLFAKKSSSSSALTSRESRTTSLTLTIVLTSLTFVILTSPALGFMIYRHIMFPGAAHHEPLSSELELIKTVCYLLWISNSAVVCYIYCLTGSKFRQQLRELVCCPRWSNPPRQGTQHHHHQEQDKATSLGQENKIMHLIHVLNVAQGMPASKRTAADIKNGIKSDGLQLCVQNLAMNCRVSHCQQEGGMSLQRIVKPSSSSSCLVPETSDEW